MKDTSDFNNTNATRTVAATIGALIGLAGIEHGVLELLQGNVRPAGIMIDAIGPQQKLWENAGEAAVTIVPSFLLTGILAILVGLFVTIWSVAFIHKKYGAWVLLLLCAILFLVGGGFAPPIFLGLIAVATASRINKPLRWWRVLLPEGVRCFLVRLWPWPLLLSVLLFVASVEIAIFGYPLRAFFPADTTFTIQLATALTSLGLMLLSMLTGFACDIQKQAGRHEEVVASGTLPGLR